MTGMLASVNSLAEAELVLAEKVDIIDLKAPEKGSLGALPVETVQEIVSAVNGRCPVSATIGDLPMQPELILSATEAMAGAGVDYVKIGFFPNGDVSTVLAGLLRIADYQKLIAVIFADTRFDIALIDAIKNAGFCGVMLDTLDKSKGSLSVILTPYQIRQFVEYAQARQLLCGLAGALRLADVPLLLPFKPNYLGFRGALCNQQVRTDRIDPLAVRQIRTMIVKYS